MRVPAWSRSKADPASVAYERFNNWDLHATRPDGEARNGYEEALGIRRRWRAPIPTPTARRRYGTLNNWVFSARDQNRMEEGGRRLRRPWTLTAGWRAPMPTLHAGIAMTHQQPGEFASWTRTGWRMGGRRMMRPWRTYRRFRRAPIPTLLPYVAATPQQPGRSAPRPEPVRMGGRRMMRPWRSTEVWRRANPDTYLARRRHDTSTTWHSARDRSDGGGAEGI
jgi:hypothetical protein